MVDLLQRALPPPEGRGAPGQSEDRSTVERSLRQWADDVRDAGTCRYRSYAHRARDAGPALRGEACVLLVANVHQTDPFLMTSIQERKDVAAAQREDVAHAQGLQRLDGYESAMPVALQGRGGTAQLL